MVCWSCKSRKKLSDIKTKKTDSRRFEYDYRIDENGKKYTFDDQFAEDVFKYDNMSQGKRLRLFFAFGC